MGFEADIDKFINEEFEKNIDEFTREITKDITFEIIDRSPIKTGKFVGNWHHSTNNEPGYLYDPQPIASVVKARLNSTLNNIKAGNVENIINNVHYGPLLEYGSSSQAPEGMVRVTFSHIEQTIRKVLTKVTGGTD